MAHFFLLTQPTIHSLSPYCHLGSVLSKMIIALSFSSSNCKYCILLWMDTYLASWTMMAIVCFLSHWKLCFMVCKPIEKDKGWVQANITSETETSILRANGVKRFCWNWVRRPGPRRPISAVGDPVHLCLKPYLRRLRNGLIQRHGPSFDVFFNLTVEGVGSHVFLLDGKAFPRAQFQQLWPSFVHLIYVRLVFRYQLSQLLQQSKEHLSMWGTHVSVWLSTTACIHLARNAKHPPTPRPWTHTSLPARDAPWHRDETTARSFKVPFGVHATMWVEQNNEFQFHHYFPPRAAHPDKGVSQGSHHVQGLRTRSVPT